MRISDWSSDVCSSDLVDAATNLLLMTVHVDFIDEGGQTLPYDPVEHAWLPVREDAGTLYWETAAAGRDWTVRHTDRKSDGSGKSLSVRVDLGGRRNVKKKKKKIMKMTRNINKL